jgi:hypothetical protein
MLVRSGCGLKGRRTSRTPRAMDTCLLHARTWRGGGALRRPAAPGHNGPQDLATLEGLAQASVTLPLPLEGPREQAAPPLAPGACLVQPRRTGQDALSGGVAFPS